MAGSAEVRLVKGAVHFITLTNGQVLRVEPFTRRGKLWAKIHDADTGAKIQTITGKADLTAPPANP